MKKKALYYAIRKSLYNPVVAVTSEKGLRRWFGRDCRYDESTNGMISDLRGRFATKEEAEGCRADIVAKGKHFDALRKVHYDEINKLHRIEEREVDELIKSKQNG